MAITKITKTELLELTSTTGAVRLPSGTTAERPSTNLNAGDFRFNTDDNKVEYYDGSNWFQIDDEGLPAVPSENFNTVIYTGDGGTSRQVTGVGFQADLVWVKRRSATEDNVLFDSVRGVQQQLRSNSDGQQSLKTNALSSFDTDGFTIGANNALNTSGETYVGWSFKAGGNSNTFNIDGTGYGTASAASLDGGQATPSGASINTEGGLGIYKVSTSTSARTMTHGLPSTPQMYIFKATGKSQNWYVSAYDGSNWKFGNLNTQSSFNTTTTYIADSSNVVIGAGGSTTEVVYAMCDIPGFQKIGTYTGNNTGGIENQIIQTDFEPAWLLIRNITSSSNDWIIVDNKRSPSNTRNRVLEPNKNNAETEQTVNVNFLTNGFELTNGNSDVNDNGAVYLYWAIAADADNTTPTLANSFKTNLYTGNGSTLTVGGHLNGAAQFNGSSSRIQLPSGAPFGDNNTIKCISGWFALSGDTNTTTHPCHIYSVSTSGSPIPWFHITVWTASYNYIACTRRQSTGNEATAAGYFTPDTVFPGWHHVAVQLGSTEIEIYLDGRKLPTVNSNSGNATNTSWIDYGNYSGTVVSQIGKSRENTPKYFRGSIDQIRFFNAALTSSQISELYNETTATANTLDFPTGAGCIAAYPLDTNSNDVGGNYNGTDSNITYSNGPGFLPSLAWIKGRGAGPSGCGNPVFFDSVRGLVAPSYLASSLTNGEFGNAGVGVLSLHKDGYTVGDDANGGGNVNGASGGLYTDGTYVGWAWKGAIKNPTINTDGSITSIVSANTAAGFRVVEWKGTGAQGTLGHGLSSAPELIISKNLSNSNNWSVYSSALGLSHTSYPNWLYLNLTSGEQSSGSSVNHPYYQAPSSTLIYQNTGTSESTNVNGDMYISYCFFSVSSYSKVGSYTGNGGSKTVYTTDDGTSGGANGFQPTWVLIKNTANGYSWIITDSTRGNTQILYANLSSEEGTTSTGITSFNSDGFTVGSAASFNNGSDTFIYLAIKE